MFLYFTLMSIKNTYSWSLKRTRDKTANLFGLFISSQSGDHSAIARLDCRCGNAISHLGCGRAQLAIYFQFTFCNLLISRVCTCLHLNKKDFHPPGLESSTPATASIFDRQSLPIGGEFLYLQSHLFSAPKCSLFQRKPLISPNSPQILRPRVPPSHFSRDNAEEQNTSAPSASPRARNPFSSTLGFRISILFQPRLSDLQSIFHLFFGRVALNISFLPFAVLALFAFQKLRALLLSGSNRLSFEFPNSNFAFLAIPGHTRHSSDTDRRHTKMPAKHG
jgi:hypothetical protein